MQNTQPVSELSQVEVVSHEVDGRVLSGVGLTPDALAETMEAREPEPAAPDTTATPATDRDDAGKFTKAPKGRERFSALTSERDNAKAEADAAKAENAALKARLDALTPRSEPRQDTPAATRTKPTEDEVGTKYATYADFVEDLADYKAEQRQTAYEAKQADHARQQAVRQTITTAVERGRQKYDDFNEVIAALDVQFSEHFLDALAALPDSEDVQYALARDKALATTVSKLSGVELGLALGDLRSSRRSVASPASTQPVVRSTQAPAPVQPVGSGTKTTSPPIEDLAAAGDYDAYKARRATELRAVARR